MFAANPMGASFDQSSTGAGVPGIGQPRVPPAVSTLRRSTHASINSPRSALYLSISASVVVIQITTLGLKKSSHL